MKPKTLARMDIPHDYLSTSKSSDTVAIRIASGKLKFYFFALSDTFHTFEQPEIHESEKVRQEVQFSKGSKSRFKSTESTVKSRLLGQPKSHESQKDKQEVPFL